MQEIFWCCVWCFICFKGFEFFSNLIVGFASDLIDKYKNKKADKKGAETE